MSGARLFFITHPDVVIDPAVAITEWPLSERGRARMRQLGDAPWVGGLTAIFASTERKAREGAEILSTITGLTPMLRADLGENDRSSTGYLARDAFEATADAFFANPEESVLGWARAVDEQARIVAALDAIMAAAEGDVAVVSHGAVGALALAHYLGAPISRRFDQPGEGGGNVFANSVESRTVLHAWQSIEALAADAARRA